MISELPTEEFFRCKGLLDEHGHIEAKAIVEEINPGRIFVDNTDFPNSGLIWLGNNDGFIFIGDESNEPFNKELNSFIDTVITPEAKKVGLTWFEAIGNHRKWDETIKKGFGHRNLGSWNQKVYTLQADDFKHHVELTIDPKYRVVNIHKSLFEDKTIKNISFLHSKILESWSSIECFFSYGIGYCIISNHNEIVSVCKSGFVAGNVHSIDIQTLEEHRGRKLAQKITRAFVKKCFDRGIIPYWDCMESNKPSIAVAVNIGFKNLYSYKGYEFPFK
ncbi:GNAT family N-acetyltransferase [Halalkalibacterium halodurans]|uniref:BH2084 protein n=1 Tax=Halalkalibacterium halodurans (strain ATCC BAA-125 / DSM 18197 / FERM 7344 / JCM 9153 / C-125) TaxID=272558 RepID=Q9KB47_HALH5|nr:GNAT family N-acetyltransferase [Halalkalibacterium halodurans]MDY7222636.1 GNAT family N-acetyltransferase [Halalkalibacterium halodurans]MDY7241857.1 GNAT family N-acetyltransferase [Halalkalibacterium halodurans]MED4082459.1 GNAT family N-acetyltransferase [Halalkalibacterium halodurans]MED4085036.1 GNAT family N-acetyltransferase [Halalkalibacterium halodurans]MED4107098.1 GNAT family N-acetyltransferase [Halalkalibacterium halodurans]